MKQSTHTFSRKVSEVTRSLINELYDSGGQLNKLFEDSSRIADHIIQIGSRMEPAVIPDILPFAYSKHLDVATAASSVLETLLKMIPVSELGWLDLQVRERSPYYTMSSYGQWNLVPADVGHFKGKNDESFAVLALTTFHSNGYIRESALKKLRKIKSGKELPFILIRLNDWVREIHKIALRSIKSRIDEDYIEHFVSNMAIINSLLDCRRHDHKETVEKITALLTSEHSYDALKNGLFLIDLKARRSCFQLVLNVNTGIENEALDIGLADHDCVIRIKCARKIRALYDEIYISKCLKKMLSNSFMPVRREALSVIIERFPDQAEDKLYDSLLDSHKSIREFARFYLAKKKEIDFAEIYRKFIKQEKKEKLQGAICGLGETGKSDDADLIVGAVTHRLAKIRKAAIRAVGKLSPKEYAELFSRKIVEDTPGISREAAMILSTLKYIYDADELWRAFKNTDKQYSKLNILFVIRHLSKWDSVSYLIEGAVSADAIVKERAVMYLEKWPPGFNRSFTKPTQDQKKRIENALLKFGKYIDDWIVKSIRFNLEKV